ncbi:putative oxidoreductase dhs-27 [Oratosquilla oratoria]|uniref:putative oxidoreductase dhs-27 n=1 Tax=Oratosquilla oratoria TaxID=337810 RepID=UPI003F75AF42
MSGRTSSTPGEEHDELPNNSHITKELVEACLQADKGLRAKLLCFEEEEITKKGENYLGLVTSISVQYRLESLEDLRTNYVVKSNFERGLSDANKLLREIFAKEIGFYLEIVPALNRELQEAGQPDLRTPKSPFVLQTEDKEIIFMDDLREQGFQMVDYKKGLDKDHTLLVVRELARLHGASFLLQRNSKVDLLTNYPYLVDGFMACAEYETFVLTFQGVLKCCAVIARLNKGYGKVAKYIEEELSPKCMDYRREFLHPCPPFVAVVHGDCWNNNILFRNDNNGVPVETMLVDFQFLRRSSPTTDLSHFFFTSLTGQVRRKNIDSFLQTYYDTLQDVVRAGGLQLDFTLEDLSKDYERRCLYGITVSLFMTSMISCGLFGGPNLGEIKDDCIDEMMKKYEESLVELQEQPDVKERFLSIFDDMIEKGFVC